MESMDTLRLRIQTVFSAVNEGKKTFADLAPNYGCTVEQFEELVLAKAGAKEYAKLKKSSERNEAARLKRAKKPQSEKAKKEQKETKIEQEEDFDMSKKDNKTNRNLLVKKIEEAKVHIASCEAAIIAHGTLLQGEKLRVQEAEKQVEQAAEALKQAQEKLDATQKAHDNLQKLMADRQTSLAKWQECIAQAEANLRELDSKVIYLVAPGYKSELPKVGQLVSVVPFEGATIEMGTELLKEPSAMDLMMSGFELISEANNAYNFARLVIKYQFLDDADADIKVLVDDDRIKRILIDQGLDNIF